MSCRLEPRKRKLPKGRATRRQIQFRTFNDFVWKNGNVPVALQRWEYLGASDEMPK